MNHRAWAVPIVLAVYVPAATAGWSVPIGAGVPYVPSWGALSAAGIVALAVAARLRRPDFPWPRPLEVAAVIAVAAMVLTDLTMTYQPRLYNFP